MGKVVGPCSAWGSAGRELGTPPRRARHNSSLALTETRPRGAWWRSPAAFLIRAAGAASAAPLVPAAGAIIGAGSGISGDASEKDEDCAGARASPRRAWFADTGGEDPALKFRRRSLRE